MQASPLDSIRDLYAQQQLVQVRLLPRFPAPRLAQQRPKSKHATQRLCILQIDEEVLRKVAENVDVNDLQAKLQRVPPPLNFNNMQEVRFLHKPMLTTDAPLFAWLMLDTYVL